MIKLRKSKSCDIVMSEVVMSEVWQRQAVKWAALSKVSCQGCSTTAIDAIHVSYLDFRFLLSGCVKKAVLSFQTDFAFCALQVFP